MSDFMLLKDAVNKQLSTMSKGRMFRVSIDNDLLWDTYLSSFPEGTDPMYRERTEHDCSCCRRFVKAAGAIATIVGNELVSVWDINCGDNEYQVVANALSALVKSKVIDNEFLHFESNLGTDHNHELIGSDVKRWDHLHFELPNQFVMKDAGSRLSDTRASKDVLKRSLEEITLEATETVLELIEQGSLYRGEEHKATVKTLVKHKKKYDKVAAKKRDNYCWLLAAELGHGGRFRNTVIGTLMTDISEGVELDKAVKKFEAKVAPENYKRPTALITKSMIANAQSKVAELGIEESLKRRHANVNDITINNVLFADRSVKEPMGVFEELAEGVADKVPDLKKVTEVDVNTFINDILPKAESIEVMLENMHENNLMSLVAPVDAEAKGIFKWGNNFSWAYNGEVADSMKERVAKAGGKVDGVLRFSIEWNHDGDDQSIDFDAHCKEPCGNHIYYSDKSNYRTTGRLDVDIQNPGSKVAVENITWTDKSKMGNGQMNFYVKNYSSRKSKGGFKAEIEYNGEVYRYSYDKPLAGNQEIMVAKVDFKKSSSKLDFIWSLESESQAKEVWGLNTQKFHKVNMVMNSPNHWDGEETGNKHLFFILDKCKNDDKVRGFFNEFLSNGLTTHRKVFEVLGSKMKAEISDDQLSGLGFSTTQRNSVYCKVKGSFSRTIKINF